MNIQRSKLQKTKRKKQSKKRRKDNIILGLTPKQIIERLLFKCVNPCADLTFGRAGRLLNSYSEEIILFSLDKFPDKYDGKNPLGYLEGIIKKEIVKNPHINSVSRLANTEALEILNDLLGDE